MKVIKCDICGADGKERAFWTGRKLGLASIGVEDTNQYLDLCDEHSWEAYLIAQSIHKFDLGAVVYEQLKAKVKR